MTVTTKQTVASPRPPDPVDLALATSGLQPAQADQAASLWQSVQARHHEPEQAARDFLFTLRQHRMHPAAGKIAASLADSYPDRPWPLVELARLAYRTGDHAGSLAAARRIVAAFPNDAAGPLHLVTALLALRQTQPAQDALSALPAAAARQTWARAARVQVAIQRRDHAGVLEQAALLRAAAPSSAFGYVAACAALRALGRGAEAEALVQQALSACPNRADVHLEAALVAEAAGGHDLALARWAAVRAVTPGSPQGYLGAIRYSRRCAQPGLTEQLLADAMATFPRNRLLLLAAARMEAGRQRWTEADVHWKTLAGLVPDDPALQVEAAMSLIGPPPGRKRRLPEVLRRLDAVHDRFPADIPAYVAHLSALREARAFDEAEACGRAWGGRFPADPALAMMRARLAQDLGRAADAVAVIEAARALAPAAAELETAYVRALSLAGRDDAAEQAVAAACASLGDDPAPARRARAPGDAARRPGRGGPARRRSQPQAPAGRELARPGRPHPLAGRTGRDQPARNQPRRDQPGRNQQRRGRTGGIGRSRAGHVARHLLRAFREPRRHSQRLRVRPGAARLRRRPARP